MLIIMKIAFDLTLLLAVNNNRLSWNQTAYSLILFNRINWLFAQENVSYHYQYKKDIHHPMHFFAFPVTTLSRV